MRETENDQEKIELLVRIARLYYEQDFSQNEIASKVGLSRSYVSKLLNEARQNGIVEIHIHDPAQTENFMEQKLREYYNLKRVIIVPKSADSSPYRKIGEAVARYINSIVKRDLILGFTWGETVYECAKAIQKRNDLGNATILQMCGGISNVKRGVYVAEIAQTLTHAFNGNGYVLPFPAIVTSREIRKILDDEPAMKEVLSHGKNADIILMTAGLIGPQCALARAGYLKEEEIDRLIKAGAVGDVCTHIINKEGKICDEELDARTIAMPLEDIMKIETRICASVGEAKLASTLGALEGGIANVFVIDEEMAEMIRGAKPEIFQ